MSTLKIFLELLGTSVSGTDNELFVNVDVHCSECGAYVLHTTNEIIFSALESF